MTKQTLKHFVLLLVCIGLLLTVPRCRAQNKLNGLKQITPEVQEPQISPPSYTFTLLHFPTARLSRGLRHSSEIQGGILSADTVRAECTSCVTF